MYAMTNEGEVLDNRIGCCKAMRRHCVEPFVMLHNQKNICKTWLHFLNNDTYRF